MPAVTYTFAGIPAFARAMRDAAPAHLIREMGRALYKIGKSDIEAFKPRIDSAFNVRAKRFRNQFKFKASDSKQAKDLKDLQLSEYTGAKLFRIFQTGGDISARSSRTMTILTDAARTSGGKRKYSQKEIQAMIAQGVAKIIQTKAGPAVILIDEKTTKGGNLRAGSKATIIAWLKPRVHEDKRIDFYANYDANEAAHTQILEEAAERAIEATEAEDDEDGL